MFLPLSVSLSLRLSERSLRITRGRKNQFLVGRTDGRSERRTENLLYGIVLYVRQITKLPANYAWKKKPVFSRTDGRSVGETDRKSIVRYCTLRTANHKSYLKKKWCAKNLLYVLYADILKIGAPKNTQCKDRQKIYCTRYYYIYCTVLRHKSQKKLHSWKKNKCAKNLNTWCYRAPMSFT